MSVLRQGSSFLQRRLTKLYTDTKSSCESVSAVARPNDDPELVGLNCDFRTQKDRLLAWGLDWSDSSAAQPNDIDEALGEAGFSDVVAGVMSSIQQVLNEAERLQQPSGARTSDGLTKASNPGGFPGGSPAANVKNTWTEEEIVRSKELLSELTGHIDTLYDMSRSRRNMSMSMASTKTQSGAHVQTRPPLSTKLSKSSKEFFESPVSSHSKTPIDQSVYVRPSESKKRYNTDPKPDQIEMSPFVNMHVEPAKEGNAQQARVDRQQSFDDSFLPTKEFCIDRAALQLSKTGGTPHAPNPPPYEAVAASMNSRALGQLKARALPAPLAGTVRKGTVPVMVEYSPISLEMQNSLVIPPKERLNGLCETLERLVDNARVYHLGLLKFVGYFIDMTYSRYAFIYQLPVIFFPLLSQPSEKMTPKPLVSFFYSGDDRQEASIPNLEVRFRLAYDLVMAVLQLRSQNVVHGNINSNNILIFPGNQYAQGDVSSHSEANLRHPYLASLSQFDGGDKNAPPEPLSSRMYRHPDDSQKISDPSSWAYDLYSLGLVLLEIGLWTPLSRLWKMKYDTATFKSRIENVYVKKLGPKCGTAFVQTVQLCLDAPNFHLSTKPMTDLGLRISQTYHYPWQEPSKCDEWCTFSKNFTYSIAKILWRCSSLDVFSPPPAEDLEEHLPPPLSVENDDSQKIQPQNVAAGEEHFGRQFDEPTVPVDFENEVGFLNDRKRPIQEKGDGNPEKRARKRTVKKWSNEDIPARHLQLWNTSIMPRISKLLQKILKDSAESCGVSLMIAGETPETAKSTICVTCTSVRKVRAALKKYFDYDRESWDLIVIRGDIQRSKVPRKKKRKGKTNKPNTNSSQPDPNPYYQTKPLCGASIGAFRQGEHLPPVSYGGAILVDGIPYGMTVHHMLDSPNEDEDDDEGVYDHPPRSAANYTGSLEISDHDFSYSWCDTDPPEALYTFEISDDEDGDDHSMALSLEDTYEEYWLSDGYSSDEDDYYADDDRDDDAASIGDTAGVFPGEEPEVVVTQPAIDDVDDNFFPSPDDKDDDHLASHLLGCVHASSGIRRWMRNGIKHEVDWALINVDESRMESRNLVPTDADTTLSRAASQETDDGRSQPHDLNKVASMEELGGLQVQCCGRTSGLQGGRISKALTLVKLHGRQTFSSSFSVDGNFGVPGDSGAWVFDKTGQVCGHVLAWSEKSRTAYIAPMQILFDDIARTLGASNVTLPACQEAPAWTTLASRIDAQHTQQPTQSPESLPRDALPLDLQKLSIEEHNHPRLGDVTGRKDVPGPTYRSVNNLVPQSRAGQRQLA